ncbi:ABC transporter substrate-binding protein [Vallicoccus soli]|uniref:ABC transporter substrate-binding protein n=1 Tax=Vallicoccus soli TaxID=2339232 RepID=A0A3A3YR27_9ACTN|nr:ABC transporter substrate-binding protein [Vallicoccus soli]RJK93826.1 ABC transporter substrate-binding protein [Vallicoccus soli]
MTGISRRTDGAGLSRRGFLAAAGALGGAALAGCGSAEPQVATGPALQDEYTGEPVTLRYWHGFTGGDGPAMQALVDRFNESQDRITVEPNTIQWNQYYQRVIAAVHAGKGPDVGTLQIDQLANLAARQTINPLDEVVTQLGLQESEFPQEVWRNGVYRGSRYGVPLDVHSLASYGNRAVLQQAGLERQPRTGEELEEQTRALLAAGVETPFWMPNRWPAHLIFLSLLWQFGGEPYAEDGSRATFDSDAGVQALTWMRRQVDAGISPPDVAQDSQYVGFKNGQGAYTWDGIWQINDLQSTDLDWDIAPVPQVGDQPASWASSHHLVLFRQRDPDDDKLLAGKAFMRYLLEASSEWTAAGMIPALASARETPEFQESPQAALADAVPTLRFLPPVPGLGDVQVQTLEIAVSNAVLGREQPAAALSGAAARATEQMQANQQKFEV